MVFVTEKELREAVEKKYGCPLKDETWDIAKPDSSEPYDEFDFEQVLSNLRDYKPERTETKRLSWDSLQLWTMPSIPILDIERLRPRMRDFRIKVLQLNEPIALEQIKPKLLRLGATTDYLGGVPIAYPERYFSEPIWKANKIGFTYCCYIGYVFMPTKTSDLWSFSIRLLGLYSIVSVMACKLKCHPALALAFLLCDINPVPYFPVMIIEGQNLNIQVPHPEVSSELICRAYSEMRNTMIREEREIQGKWARPRSKTDRVCKLLGFIKKNQSSSWKERFKRWNDENDQWRYDSLHSMQVTYYRAKKSKGS